MTASAPAGPIVRFHRSVAESLGGLPGAFWWLWAATLVNRLGGVVTFLALYLTADRGYSASYAGVVASLIGLGSAIAALVGGVLADRIGRRPTLLAAQLLTALTTAALGFADGQLAIASTAFLVGLSSYASRPATSAIIADLVPAADRARAFALNYWAINIGFGVSAALAGLVAAHDYRVLFLVDALSTLLCAVVVFARVPETRPVEPQRDAAGPGEGPGEGVGEGAGSGPSAGLGTVFRDRRFMALVGLTFAFGLMLQQGNTTLAVDMGKAGLTSTQYGVVIGINGLLIVLLQIPVTRLTKGQHRGMLLLVSALLTGSGFGLTAFAGSSALYYAATVGVWTLGEMIQAPTSMSLVSELSATSTRGRYQGVNSLAWSAASFLGPVAGGLLLDHAGRGALWGCCAVLGTVAAAGYLALGRRVDTGRYSMS
ncbi:MDR family MFS transporter [Kitasatospora sp. NPDC059812]|uniref:MDR family MFS transporter n=1 Tax=Kitasatospora sp. NPDC059812 TaxID=3346958 RepID=UPI0036610992